MSWRWQGLGDPFDELIIGPQVAELQKAEHLTAVPIPPSWRYARILFRSFRGAVKEDVRTPHTKSPRSYQSRNMLHVCATGY